MTLFSGREPSGCQVQNQQPREDFLIGQLRRPAIGCGDSGVELLVRQVEPTDPQPLPPENGAASDADATPRPKEEFRLHLG